MSVILKSLALAASMAIGSAAIAATPDGKGMTPKSPVEAAGVSTQLKMNIKYHGGAVMNKAEGTNVYYIWYGDWSGDTATSILTTMMQNVTGSGWYNTNTTYYGGSKTAPVYVTNKVNYKGATTDSYTYGTALSDAQIQQVVANAISSGRVPKDDNAIYFVLTSKDVTATSGFCSQYCGWHNHATIAGADIKYSFVGNAATQCASGCITSAIQTKSPNNNPGADGMASVVMHELVEAISDPDLNAWSDTIGQENADKCAWKFGTTKASANGSVYNVNFGTGQYLIQQNWSAAGTQGCKTTM